MPRSFLLLLVFTSWWAPCGHADGAWVKAVPTPQALFPLEFILLKTAAFSNAGKLKPRLSTAELSAICPSHLKVTAWVSHRLSAGEVMSPESATRLARELNALLLPASCVTAVELDVEPLLDSPSWFPVFCQTLRAHLDKKLVLRAAIPTVGKRGAGTTTWPESSALALLAVIDGLDFMVYDTGAKTAAEYEETLKEAVAFAERTEKPVTLGLPAYPDKTQKHRPAVENINVVAKTLQQLPQAGKALCRANLHFAYYAGWTMTDEEKRVAARFREWRRSLCAR